MREYNKANIPRARELRKNMTPWERKLWYDFLRTYPIRFQRQKAIGNYIVDFFCAKACLALELDGGGHYEFQQAARDDARTCALRRMGVRVVRVCNMDVDGHFREVCEMIDHIVKMSLPPAASPPPPSQREAREAGCLPSAFSAGNHSDTKLLK